jgi:hypothetical protein
MRQPTVAHSAENKFDVLCTGKWTALFLEYVITCSLFAADPHQMQISAFAQNTSKYFFFDVFVNKDGPPNFFFECFTRFTYGYNVETHGRLLDAEHYAQNRPFPLRQNGITKFSRLLDKRYTAQM